MIPASQAADRPGIPDLWQQAIVALLAALLCLSPGGCSSWRAPATLDDGALRERAVTATNSGIQVSATVLSRADNLEIFAADIDATGVQSIWVEIANHSEHTLWLLQSGTDPDYFSPLEVAWSLHQPFASDTNSHIDDHLDSLAMKSLVPPGETRSGILYTNPHHHMRLLHIDLLGQQAVFPFTLFLPIPGEHSQQQVKELKERLSASRNHDYPDEAAFRTALEQLTCCAGDPRTPGTADPVNVIFIGEPADIGSALVRRGYRRDPRDNDRQQRLFGRSPDVVLRKSGQGGVPANWLRLWVAPLRYQGQPVLLAQSGRPVGGRFTPADEKPPRLHPDIDATRVLVIEDMMYSGGLARLGYVEGTSLVSDAQLHDHRGESAYRSDGLCAVLFINSRPLSLSDVEILDWVMPPDTRQTR